MCGCGVGFKLVQALASTRDQTIDDLVGYLDLVAIAIAADIVPMTGENRVLAYFGLQVINTNPRTGVKAMIHQVKKTTLTITDVVFIIAPRINAAGRIKHGNYAVELLTELNFETAIKFAADIENYNKLHQPKFSNNVIAEDSGYIQSMDTYKIGLSTIELGCGRKKTTDIVDPTAGIQFDKKIGDKVNKGDTILKYFNSDDNKLIGAETLLRNCFQIGEDKVNHKLILD